LGYARVKAVRKTLVKLTRDADAAMLMPVEIHTFVARLTVKAKSVKRVYKAPQNLTEHQSFIGVLIPKKP